MDVNDHKRCVRIRSYEVPSGSQEDQDLSTCTIIEAARATSAAPTYFPAITIGSSTYFDGAMKYNNPILEVVDEVRTTFGNLPVGCLVSIGTGTSEYPPWRPSLFGTVGTLTRLATDTEAKHTDIKTKADYEDLRPVYFRFNVDGLGDVDLSGWQELPEIKSKTKEFLRETPTEDLLRESASLIVQREKQDEDTGAPSEDTLKRRFAKLIEHDGNDGGNSGGPSGDTVERQLSRLCEHERSK